MPTYIDEIEAVVTEVAEWAAGEITSIVNALAPDGRPFLGEKVSIEEQLTVYRGMRNDVTAWQAWISNKAIEITNMLVTSGMSPETINAVNPLDIAISYSLAYSSTMERELEKRMI